MIRHHILGGMACILALAAAPAAEEIPLPWSPPPVADPLRWSSLPLDPSRAEAPRRGQWAVSVTASSFNVIQSTWHAGTVHRGLGRLGAPLASWELRIIERDFPADTFYYVDLEGWRADVRASVGLGRGVAASIGVSWIDVGRPHWDAVAEDFHSLLGLSQSRRDWFPRGQTLVYIHARHRTLERRDDLLGSGAGDSSLALTGPMGRWLGADHRWVAALQVPTGTPDTLRGTGGWDVGLRWFATWTRPRCQWRAAAGFTRVDRHGRWLGLARNDTWHALGEVRMRRGRRWVLRGSARLDASPVADATGGALAVPAFYASVGAVRLLGRGSWVAFDLGDNFPVRGTAPDYTLHLQWGTRLGGP